VKYFPDINDNNNLIQNSFSVKEKPVGFSTIDYGNLINITSDNQTLQKFEE
jgi:hypothetical protein